MVLQFVFILAIFITVSVKLNINWSGFVLGNFKI